MMVSILRHQRIDLWSYIPFMEASQVICGTVNRFSI